jgi:hypothetical protein
MFKASTVGKSSYAGIILPELTLLINFDIFSRDMAIERIWPEIEDAPVNPDTSSDDQRLVSKTQALIQGDRMAAQAKVEADIRRQRKAEEARAAGERIGVPVGRFLAGRGVTTATPILEVVPRYVSGYLETAMFEESRMKSGVIPGPELEKKDFILAIKAFNVLGIEARGARRFRSSSLTEHSVMGDVSTVDMHLVSGAGPHVIAILQEAVNQLPPPNQSSAN